MHIKISAPAIRLAAVAVLVGVAPVAMAAPISCPTTLHVAELNSPAGRTNEYVKLLAYSNFVARDYNSAKNDDGSGYGIPSGKLVFGGDFDEARYNRRKAFLAASFKYSVPWNRHVDVAIASGIPAVLAHWKQCAQDQGGIAVRFEPISQKDAFAFVEFYGAPGTKARLLGNVGLPAGVTATTGQECLQAGRDFLAGQQCTILLSLPSPETTVTLGIPTDQGLALGYLAARVKLSAQSQPFAFTSGCDLTTTSSESERARCGDRLYRRAVGTPVVARHTVVVPGELATDGWEFDLATANLDIKTLARKSPPNTSWCDQPHVTTDGHSFTYGYRLKVGTEHGSSSSLTCTVNPSIEMSRQIWVPQG